MYYRYPTALRAEEFPKILLKSYVMKDFNKLLFGGMDGIYLANMARVFNFTPHMIYPADADYGYKLPNGTFVGNVYF